jgi:ferritin
MLSTKIQDAFNDQLNAELFSSYLYLSMAAYFESQNLGGMARWMQMQAQEENAHAMKIFGFIHERGGQVVLKQIDAPQVEWASPLAAFKDAYKHEQHITERINKLVELCESQKDYPGGIFLQWFVTEQVEEESTALGIVEKLKAGGDQPGFLLMFDRYMGQRGAQG